MLPYLNKLTIMMALVAALLWGASPARAAFTIELKEDGLDSGPIVLVPGNIPNVTALVFGDYQVTIISRSSSPGTDPTTGQALLQHSDLNVQLTNALGAPLEIILQDTGYANTLGSPVVFEGSVASSFISPGGTVDASHALNGVTLITNATLVGTSPAGQPVPASDFKAVLASPGGGATFTMSSDTILNLNGVTGASAQFTVTTQASPVPAPTGIVLALGAVPFLGLGRWLRRRRQQA